MAYPFGTGVSARAREAILEGASAERLETMSPVAQQIIDARSHKARAALVLRLSDDVVVEAFEDLKAACYEVRFPAGAQYLSLRLAATCATRDAAGRMPSGITEDLELWRRGLAALAQVPS